MAKFQLPVFNLEPGSKDDDISDNYVVSLTREISIQSENEDVLIVDFCDGNSAEWLLDENGNVERSDEVGDFRLNFISHNTNLCGLN